jgi:hypothetical protein
MSQCFDVGSYFYIEIQGRNYNCTCTIPNPSPDGFFHVDYKCLGYVGSFP